MNLEELLFDSSKICILRASEAVFADTGLIEEMYKFALSERPKYARRAVRVLNIVAEHGPGYLNPFLSEILNKIPKLKDDSLRSNFLRIFTIIPLPDDEDFIGLLTQLCFDYLKMQFEKAGVKVYCIDILYRVSQSIPELKHELVLTIMQQKQYDSTAFRSRGTKILKKLRKELGEEHLENEFGF